MMDEAISVQPQMISPQIPAAFTKYENIMPTDFFLALMASSVVTAYPRHTAAASAWQTPREPLQAVSLALQWALSRPYPQKREIIRSNGESCGS